MLKLNNKNMVSLFIWLGLLGGILVVISIAGYRHYSGKINQDRNDNITQADKNLSIQMNKNDSVIISKLDDVGNKINEIHANDASNIKEISFPQTGHYGKNILDKELLEIAKGTYSMKAILPKNHIINVKVSGVNWTFSVSQPTGGWDHSNFDINDKSRIFTTIKYGIADLKIDLTKGETEIKLFIGNSEKPEWTKIIKVK